MSKSVDSVLFASQFQPDGDGGYLYRYNQNGPAIRVTAEEKARFLAGYEQANAYLRLPSWPWFALLAAIWIAGFFLPKYSSDVPGIGAPAPLILWIIERVIANRRSWAAPLKAVAGRPPVAPAIDGPASRNTALAARTWPRIGLDFLIITTVMIITFLTGWHGNELEFLLGSGFVMLGYGIIATQAFFKWKFRDNKFNSDDLSVNRIC
jgi:hypothetical protein